MFLRHGNRARKDSVVPEFAIATVVSSELHLGVVRIKLGPVVDSAVVIVCHIIGVVIVCHIIGSVVHITKDSTRVVSSVDVYLRVSKMGATIISVVCGVIHGIVYVKNRHIAACKLRIPS